VVLHAAHLCSGYGGVELALRLAGIPARTVVHVERDAYAAATLVARMEEAHLDPAPIWSDLCTFDGGAWRGRVDLVSAGFPCQPFSSAGQRRGVDDDRWLWPAVWKCVRDMGPRFLFLENVPQLVRHGLPHVLADLAEDGWAAEWGLLSASAVGAPHKRERFWLLAHAEGSRRREPEPDARPREPDPARSLIGLADPDRPRSEGAGVRRHEPAQRGVSVAHADGDGWGGQRVPVGREVDGTEAQGCCAVLADSDGGRYEGIGREPQHDRDARNDADRCGLPAAWPPGRDDRDGWVHYLAEGGPEPAVRRGADGRPSELADALHLGGNGLVPAVAAHAFVVLADRLGLDPWSLT